MKFWVHKIGCCQALHISLVHDQHVGKLLVVAIKLMRPNVHMTLECLRITDKVWLSMVTWVTGPILNILCSSDWDDRSFKGFP
jgi:hypothetical protein